MLKEKKILKKKSCFILKYLIYRCVSLSVYLQIYDIIYLKTLVKNKHLIKYINISYKLKKKNKYLLVELDGANYWSVIQCPSYE